MLAAQNASAKSVPATNQAMGRSKASDEDDERCAEEEDADVAIGA